MDFQIAPNVHYCIASNQVVFLDLSTDRYLGLPPAPADVFLRLKRSEKLTSKDAAALTLLTEHGLLVACGDASILRQPALVAPPVASTYTTVHPFHDLPNLPVAMLAHARASLDLKVHKLGRTIARLRDRKAMALKTGHIAGRPCQEGIAGFLATRRLIPSQERCLRWSVATIHYLAAKRHFPDLVLGVRMAPFHAHAWVQHDGVVLNDTVDFVSHYTPILAV